MENSAKVDIINVNIERGESGAFFATSAEVTGLHVAGMTESEVTKDIPRAIAALYLAGGKTVTVEPVDGQKNAQWVARAA